MRRCPAGRTCRSPPSTGRAPAWWPARPTPSTATPSTLAERDVGARRLRTSHAFHSPMMEPILGEFLRAGRRGAAVGAGRAVPVQPDRHLDHRRRRRPTRRTGSRHLRETVRFGDGVGTLLAERRLDAGRGRTRAAARRPGPDAACRPPSSAAAADQPARAGGPGRRPGHAATPRRRRLWVAGVGLDVDARPTRRPPGAAADLPVRAQALLGRADRGHRPRSPRRPKSGRCRWTSGSRCRSGGSCRRPRMRRRCRCRPPRPAAWCSAPAALADELAARLRAPAPTC